MAKPLTPFQQSVIRSASKFLAGPSCTAIIRNASETNHLARAIDGKKGDTDNLAYAARRDYDRAIRQMSRAIDAGDQAKIDRLHDVIQKKLKTLQLINDQLLSSAFNRQASKRERHIHE